MMLSITSIKLSQEGTMANTSTDQSTYTEWGKNVQSHIKRSGISQRELLRRAFDEKENTYQSNFNKALHGVPTFKLADLEAIYDTLGIYGPEREQLRELRSRDIIVYTRNRM